MPESFDVSVLIPTRNRRAFFEKALQDIVCQDFIGRLQVVVSVNGSSDDTAAFLQGYDAKIFTDKDWSLEYTIQEKSLCIQDNWNFLLGKVNAPLFGFHLDDDGWDCDYLKIGTTHLAQNPDCVVALINNRGAYPGGEIADGWVERNVHQVPPLVKNRIKPGVMTAGEYLGFSVSRPIFTLSQYLFRSGKQEMKREDGSHFDQTYLLSRLSEGNVFVDTGIHCTINYPGNSYGSGDLLTGNEAHEIAISKAMLNGLYNLKQDDFSEPELRDFARRRGAKCAIQYAKSLVRGRPLPEMMTLALRFEKASRGNWHYYKNIDVTKDDK